MRAARPHPGPLGLAFIAFAAVGMAAVHQYGVGAPAFLQQRRGLLYMAGIKLGPLCGCRRAAPGVHAGLPAVVSTAGAPSCVREGKQWGAGRENGIHSDLQIAISTILETHGHRQARSQLPVDFDSPLFAPRWRPRRPHRIVLSQRGIQELSVAMGNPKQSHPAAVGAQDAGLC